MLFRLNPPAKPLPTRPAGVFSFWAPPFGFSGFFLAPHQLRAPNPWVLFFSAGPGPEFFGPPDPGPLAPVPPLVPRKSEPRSPHPAMGFFFFFWGPVIPPLLIAHALSAWVFFLFFFPANGVGFVSPSPYTPPRKSSPPPGKIFRGKKNVRNPVRFWGTPPGPPRRLSRPVGTNNRSRKANVPPPPRRSPLDRVCFTNATRLLGMAIVFIARPGFPPKAPPGFWHFWWVPPPPVFFYPFPPPSRGFRGSPPRARPQTSPGFLGFSRKQKNPLNL